MHDSRIMNYIIRVGRFCPLGQNLVVLTRLKPSCPKPLGWTKLDKTSKFNSYSSLTVLSKFCPSYIQVLSKFCPGFVQVISKFCPGFVQVLFVSSMINRIQNIVMVINRR